MKLSISVQMHPAREKFRPYLKERLGRRVPFVMDRARGYWDTFRRAWLAHNPKAQYHTVIQDDALVCDDFRARAEAALEGPVMPYSWYFGNRLALRPLAREALPAGYIDHRHRWSLAMCLPVGLIARFIRFGDRHTPEGPQQTHLKAFLDKSRLKVRYVLPSLIDHRDTEPSLINEASAAGRRAFAYIDRREDP